MNIKLTNYFEARKIHDSAFSVLELEVNRIVTVIRQHFKQTDAWWDYDFTEEGTASPLPKPITQGHFLVYISEKCASSQVNYSRGFPVKFFDMSDVEILAYLEAEQTQDAMAIAARKSIDAATALVKKKELETLKASARAKLSKAELDALRSS